MLRTTIRKPASEPDRTICHRMRHRANPSDPIRKRPGLTMRALTFASTSKGTWSAGAAFQIASSVTLGGGLGLLAWTPGHTPALGALFPMLWIGRPSRVAAFACAVAYHLAVVRFLPGFAANWFGSIVAGFACWLAVGFVSGLVWAVLWPPSGSKALRVMLSALAVLVMLLLPPFGALVPAHPVVAWGYLAPGSGWVGVALMFILTPTAAAWLRTHERVFPESHVNWTVFGFLFAVVGIFGLVPQQNDGRSASQVLAVQTQFGRFPAYGSVDVMQRLVRMGELSALQADGQDTVKAVVFPETIIGLYDRSLQPAIDLELVSPTKAKGQTLVLGADLALGGNRFQNAALIFRPDGSSNLLAARQTVPIAQWRPWSRGAHFPADWLATNTVDLGGGRRARFMFCHEEWMAVLHLLSEAREEHELVIAMANLWAAPDPTASYVQGAHTQGMALLFGRAYVRAVNGPEIP
jgi:hypothetical protein